MKYITPENLFDFAFVNTDCLKTPVRGVCVCFHGFTDDSTFDSSPEIARALGEAGIAWVYPYYSVWGWMGKESMEYCEQVLDAAWKLLGLEESTPLVASGGSMGGLTALMYCVKGKRPVIACAADSPVTDIWKYYDISAYSRRAILSAYIMEEGDLRALADGNSPLYNVYRLPDIPYFLLFGELDEHFMKEHMPSMVSAMEERGLRFTLWVEKGMGHCGTGDFPKAMAAYTEFILNSFPKN